MLIDCKFNLFYFTLTAYFKQLSEETNRTSLMLGIPFSNRSTKNVNAVGYFANALPIQVDLEGKNARELVEHVHQKVLSALQFSEIPFSLLVRQLQPTRDRHVNPIFQRMLMFEDFNVEKVSDLFRAQEIDSDYAKFDQTWHARKNTQNQLEIHVEYNQSLFTANGVKKSIEEFEQQFNRLIEAFSKTAANSTNTPNPEELNSKLFQFLKEELAQPNIELNENSNFFELGLHSLNAALLASRIRTELGLNCSTKQIFEHQTIDELSSMLKREINEALYEVSHQQATILRSMKENQSRVLRDQYCNEFSIKLDGMRKEEIEAKIFRMIHEQEAFRTRFYVKGDEFLLQVLSEHDLIRTLPYCVRSEDFKMETVFIDLRKNNELYIRLSHLISDAYSMQLMMGYLSEGLPTKLNATASEFNSKFNKKCKEEEAKTSKFWKSILNEPSCTLFRDHHVRMPTKSASCSLSVSKSLIIEEFKRSKVSPNAFLLHKLSETLKHWQSTEDQQNQHYIGVAKDMRSSFPNTDFSQTIGFFTQTLPIPCKNKTLNELNSLLFDVYDHSFVCYGQLLELSKHSTLFEVMLALNFEEELELKVEDSKEVNGKFPLTFYVKLTKEDVNIQLVYWSELWAEETALSMLETFVAKIKSEEVGFNTNTQLNLIFSRRPTNIHYLWLVSQFCLLIQLKEFIFLVKNRPTL
jgi:acyl carrier protein